MLENLPEDIIIIILKKLDFNSLVNLSEVSKCMQNIIMVYKVVKECDISLSKMATIQTLRTHLFKDIAHNLFKLNLRGVTDLCKSALMPIMIKLKNLETLDISYTNIDLLDFMDIYKLCPTIKKVTVNFTFGKKCSSKVAKGTLIQCQNVFKHLDCVHFIGNAFNLMYSNIALFILSLANLNILQYTIVEEDTIVYRNIDCEDVLSFNEMYLCVPFMQRYGNIRTLIPLHNIDFQNYEYLIIKSNIGACEMYATQIFNKFVYDRFSLKVDPSIDIGIFGNVCIMLWRKDTQEFDDNFFNTLYKKIKHYFICYFDDENHINLSQYDRFCTKPSQKESSDCTDSNIQVEFKKRRVAPPSHILNYDLEFSEKYELELSLIFTENIKSAVTLPTNCEYLKKITYLSLTGSVKYCANFFNTLFRSCTKLVTLNIEENTLSMCAVSRSIPLSHSIKNLRLVGKHIDFNNVLTSLSQCSTLENVHIGDKSIDCSTIFDPTTMLQNCKNLYCVYIYKLCIPESKLSKQLKLIDNAKAICQKLHVNFKVLKSEKHLAHVSNPYIDVFRLCQIKPIQIFYQSFLYFIHLL